MDVLLLGLIAVTVYGLRQLLERHGHDWARTYVPIVGGLIEIGMVFFFWVAVLEAWRTGRSLRREPAIWSGLTLV